LFIAALVGSWVQACSLCPGLANRPSLRQEALQAKHVYYGTMSNPRLNAVNAAGLANASATDFTVDQVVKAASANRKSQKQITIPRYIPVDAKEPPKYIVFCDEQDGKLDPYRGTPVKSAALIEYLKGATNVDAKDAAKILDFAGKYLDHADPDVASEAYLEFARSNDADVLAAAKRLDRKRVRKLLDDPQTPIDRLALFAYLLGACGSADDAKHLRYLLQTPGDRHRGALSGLYAGLIMLKPEDGWTTLLAAVSDPKKPFGERNSALTALRFYHNANPTAYRDRVLAGLKELLTQDDIADLAIEDLRRWQLWALTDQVLELFDRPTHQAPLMRRTIVRYALCAPNPAAKEFIDRTRLKVPDLIKDVEESLEYERGAKP
jgi:hypothetical protein